MTHRTAKNKETPGSQKQNKALENAKNMHSHSNNIIGYDNLSKAPSKNSRDNQNKTYDVQDEYNLDFEDFEDEPKEQKEMSKQDAINTHEITADKMILDEMNDSKKSIQGDQIQLNLNDSFLNNDKLQTELDSANYDYDNAAWKLTPLFLIAHGCDSDQDIINTLLDIKGIDHERTGIQGFKNLEIIEFENEVNIIHQALKRKVNIETLIICSSVEDSKDTQGNGLLPPKVEESNNFHSFVHTSRYTRILENTIRYLLHCVGLSKFLNNNSISDKANKNKVDYLENEIKMCILIQKLFKFIKDWFIVFQTYNTRDVKIAEVREGLKSLRFQYQQLHNSKLANPDHVNTIEENELIEI